MHTDIKTNNRLIASLPESWRAYAYLARLDRPVGVWLLLLPGWCAIALASGGFWGMGAHGWGVFALFGAGALIMRSAGCVINDLWDRDLDQKVERTRARPLAAGDLSFREGLVFLLALLMAGFIILMQMNAVTIALGFASLPLIVLYPLMKRWTWWPQAFLGLVFNFSALMGWSAVTASLAAPAIFLYIGCFFWTLGYDTIYAHQDKEDDALAGIRSTALKFGSRSKIWVSGFYGTAWLCIVLSGLTSSAGGAFYLGLVAAAGHLIWQLRRWNIDDQTGTLRIFKSNRDFGLFILLACLAG
ncbi:MAG: 4-hydroxybenzoate octaprenyltransferase [Alphaproteobacteria bacterium]|nr:4-hydroxybenzoate octaprenyltransferase [Alphaproteobacteria bacterium]